MDYVELANKASEYGLFKEASGVQGQGIYIYGLHYSGSFTGFDIYSFSTCGGY